MSGVEYRGKVREHGRETSWDAAARQTEPKSSAVKATITSLLNRYGEMTDEQLFDRYEAAAYMDGDIPKVTATSVRTRRHEMHVDAKVTDTGRRGRTRAGSTAIIWAVVI